LPTVSTFLFDTAHDGVTATIVVYDPTNTNVLVTNYIYYKFASC